ncbi:MAG: hypothetical protein COB49_03100 [Alphaproteobacteria bacterium]|nr:MAG: hypothetical protein COB49_03100 [Alphaproteobacteria bacterium]
MQISKYWYYVKNNEYMSVRTMVIVLLTLLSSNLLAACNEGGSSVADNAVSALPSSEMPLGHTGLPEVRKTEILSPGLFYHKILRGVRGTTSPWVLSSGVLQTEERVRYYISCANKFAIHYVLREHAYPGHPDRHYNTIQLGSFPDKKQALSFLELKGYDRDQSIPIVDEDIDPDFINSDATNKCNFKPLDLARDSTTGYVSWQISILELDPDTFKGDVKVALAQGLVAGRQTTTEISQKYQAIAAVNAGFFTMVDDDGVMGEPAGISIINGTIESEPTNGRPVLVIQKASMLKFEVIVPQTQMWIQWEDGLKSRIDGINRRPSLIRNCGNSGDKPSDLPYHDRTCSDENEIIALTAKAGFNVPAEEGYSVYYDMKTRSLYPPKERIPPNSGDLILVGIGQGEQELHRRLANTSKANVRIKALPEAIFGRLRTQGLYAVNGGPTLFKNGEPYDRDDLEGWAINKDISEDQANKMHGWINVRNPRTAVGIQESGRIFIITIDGRAPGISVGVTIPEMREVMAFLEVQNAINLDGGGSTAMVVHGKLVNRPSDSTGERPVGDAIVILP